MFKNVKRKARDRLENAIDKANTVSDDRVPFDPSALNDSVAMQAGWTPRRRKQGASFQTHKLVAVNSNRIELRGPLAIKLTYFIFLLAGIGMIIGVFYTNLSSGEFSFNETTFAASFLGLVCAGVGGCLLYFDTAPIVFDQRRGYFWKGRQAPDEVLERKAAGRFAELEQIHALQLISKRVRTDRRSYYSFELNIVLDNASRINVVNYGNPRKIREDAITLSEFLGKPVWDAI